MSRTTRTLTSIKMADGRPHHGRRWTWLDVAGRGWSSLLRVTPRYSALLVYMALAGCVIDHMDS
jgi:hypothetical protein